MNNKTLFNPTLHNPRMIGVSNMRLFDAVVAPNRNEGDYTQVDQAIDAGAKSIFIKPGTYDRFTANVAELFIMGSGKTTIIDGATLGHAITVSAAYVNICNLAAKTTAGSGNSYDAINSTGDDLFLDNIVVIGSDAQGIVISGDRTSIRNCQVLGADSTALSVACAFCDITNNVFVSPVGVGIVLDSNSADNVVSGNKVTAPGAGADGIWLRNISGINDNVIIGNVVYSSGRYGIYVEGSNNNDNVIVGNRVRNSGSTAIQDAGTSTTTSGNDTTA